MDQLINQLTLIIKDYRYFPSQDIDSHIRRWIDQFDTQVQYDILSEMIQLMSRCYVSESSADRFIISMLTAPALIGSLDADVFWRNSSIFNIQTVGDSQKELLLKLDQSLIMTFGFGISNCNATLSLDGTYRYIYIDDGLYTGNRIFRDLQSWVEYYKSTLRGQTIELVIMVFFNYSYGSYSLGRNLRELEKDYGIKINEKILQFVWLENRVKWKDQSDVFWPKNGGTDANVNQYLQSLQGNYPIIYRDGDFVGKGSFFSSPQRRELLENELLKAGVMIRNQSGKFGVAHRPLGYSTFKSCGFGSTVVTYRNCPNNAPLAFWATTYEWYPLFPRKIN